MIWQIYHVESEEEYDILMRNALENAFSSFTRNSELTHEETFPGWRETHGWLICLNNYRFRIGTYAKTAQQVQQEAQDLWILP
jgi:hypothetical protein